MIVKGLPLILKHLRHNWIRTASTVLAMTLCIFLFCTLEHVVSAIEWGLKNANATRLFTRHSVSLTFPMPPAYKERIASVSGVRAVAISNWFGGVYQDAKNFFTNFAVEAEPYFSMYPEYSVPPDQMSEFLKDLKGCILGRETAKKFGWDIGSVFQLESFIPSYRKQEPFEFTVRGIYDTDLEKHPGIPQNMMFFHFKYLYEGTGQKAQVGTFISQVADPDKASEVSRAIDLLFESSDAPTRTETEAAFIASFISLSGNLAYLLHSIGLAVIFTILLVTANTMSMAARERRTEIGILKTLGFSDFNVFGLILTEALILGFLGGGLGVGIGQVMIRILPKLPMIGSLFAMFRGIGLTPGVAVLGFSVALAIGLAAGLIPALLSYRARVTALLRQV